MLRKISRQNPLSIYKATGVAFFTSKDRHNQNTKKYPTEEKIILKGDKLRKPGGRKLTHVGRSDRVLLFHDHFFGADEAQHPCLYNVRMPVNGCILQ